ncbi:MAG: polysulfide reductase NrfD [Desulfobacteraceae bacterium]|nr:polysulfide reductase NrfD [Desulfobacteraceae bacterium]
MLTISENALSTIKSLLKPDKTWLTPFNIVCGVILALGGIATLLRFTFGLSAVTNLSDYQPWGLWIGFDLLCGVALAAGGYVTSASCYIFGLKRYHSAVRPAILTAFLGYALVVFALHYDVGRPWRLPYPFIIQSGTTSVLFEVGGCVALYLTVLFIEFTPPVLEWLGLKKARNLVVKLTLVLTIFGVILSTLHQSSLGALFLIAPSKLHPLWYSMYLPVYFFVSSIIAGLSMVMFEGSLSHKYMHDKMDKTHLEESENVVLGFAKAASFVMAGYFVVKLIGITMDNNWRYLFTGYGLWYLVELFGFVLTPCLMYAVGVREKNIALIRKTAGIAVLGIVLNRFNISLIAFNYHLPLSDRYFPHIWEFVVSAFIVVVGLLVFRFISSHTPILYEHPEYKEAHH